ncbi:MAG TPA: phosphoserine phosphatase SerB [Acidimicrobiia bacterium]|nr:phosphoserine phosphatase SerB [Acidimicrobiia bacterium]
MSTPTTILCRIHGLDRPGITAGLMQVLATTGADLYDVEQVVVRGRLTLDVLFSAPEGQSTVKDLLFYGWEAGLEVDFDVVETAPSSVPLTAAVTIVGVKVGPAAFGAAAEVIAKAGGNIDRIVRLSRYPVVSYELMVAGGVFAELKQNLVVAAAEHGFDVAVQEERLERRMKRLVVIDVDSTLIQDEAIDMLAERAGVAAEVAAVTDLAMEGRLDFARALEERVALLAGLDVSILDQVAREVRLTPGARTLVRTLKRAGMRTAIVSGGFTRVTDHLAQELGVDHAVANTLQVVDGRLTGRLEGEIVDRAGKARVVREIAEAEGIPLEQVVAIGDGANDLDMLATAGLGVAFNARSKVRAAADAALNVPFLDAILFMLGIPRHEIAGNGDEDVVPVPGLPPV